MALTANRDVDHYVDQELRSVQVKAGVHVFKGAFVAVEKSSGYAKPVVAAAGETTASLFIGIAYEEADNTNGQNGDLSVRVYTQGDFGHAVTGAAITDIGGKVYASADDTLELTDGSGENVFIGRVQDWVSGSECIVRLHGGADGDSV